MSKYLEFITYDEIKERQAEFSKMRSGISSVLKMLSYYLEKKSKIEASGVGKIIVKFSNKKEIRDLIDVFSIEDDYQLDMDKLNDPDIAKAREYFLHVIYQIMLPVLKQLNVDIVAFENVLAMMKEKNYVFEEIYKSKWNPSRKIQANIRVIYTKWAYVYLDLIHKETNTKETLYICNGLQLHDLTNLKWQDNHTVLLYIDGKRDYLKIDIILQDIEYMYQPALSGNPHGQYNHAIQLLNLIMDLPKCKERGMYWLEESAKHGFPKAVKLLEQIKNNDSAIKRYRAFREDKNEFGLKIRNK